MRILRVFPRRTKATPIDDLVHIGNPDLFSENSVPVLTAKNLSREALIRYQKQEGLTT
jgi:hypothetical protein